MYYDLGRYDRAIADYTEAIKLQPDYAMFYYNRCLAYKQTGERDKAIKDCRQALKLNPKYKRARNSLRRMGTSP